MSPNPPDANPPSATPAAPVASIDDLLGFEEEPVVEDARPRSPAGWWIRNALLVLVVAAATVAALRVAGVHVSWLLVVAAVAAVRALQRLVAAVAPPPAPRAVPRRRAADEDGTYHWQNTDALRSAVRRWEQQLGWSQTDAARFSRNVLPVLAELTDERLRLRHGITRESDPQRARALLGEPYWRMLAEPDSRPPKARDLAAHVETLEQL
jgi:hypothetical protein